ncbi:MAG TPA: CvpA family protein, partial [Chthoniobacteraceae bacterium]
MPSQTIDYWQTLFVAGAALLILMQAWRGWRLGFFRECAELLGVAGAYLSSIFFGHYLTPFFRGFHLPDKMLNAVAGGFLGLSVYLAISITGSLVFRKTGRSTGLKRLGVGAGGAVLGAFFGMFMLWLMT